MRILVLASAVILIAADANAACGERGGPAFRKPDGKCAGWTELDRACGKPPTTNCTYEGGGIGATSLEKGKQFIAGMVPGAAVAAPAAASSFAVRQTKTEGVACVNQAAVAKAASCALGVGQPTCKEDVAKSLAAGECAKLSAGTQARIEAGSHSFDWVRFTVPGQAKPLWAQRGLLLD